MNNLLQKLQFWRQKRARLEGVEAFRVLPNKVLESIAQLRPSNEEELLAIKGIRDKKLVKYGQEILEIINNNNDKENLEVTDIFSPEKPFLVSSYLDFLNKQLSQCQARIKGEISSVDIREKVVYFSLKDSEDESVINCLIWKHIYELIGINFAVGMEIIIAGAPDVYKPLGKLTFKASSAELVGEGALKKAYDQLKEKLTKEGLFSLERKKALPKLVQKIGVISSRQGAVIDDFLNNLGQYGYQIKFMNSRVEGQAAVSDLVSALDYFSNKEIDVLVIIRGGGSLESLQAFNNEVLVRRLAGLEVPVICGIGHEKDVPLASLVADVSVSTPTAVSTILNQSWDKVLDSLRIFERDLVYKYQEILVTETNRVETMARNIQQKSEFVFKRFELLTVQLNNKLLNIEQSLKSSEATLKAVSKSLLINLKRNIDKLNEYLDNAENRLKVVDPLRQLKLGYSTIRIKGALVRSVKQIKVGDELEAQVSDGKIKSQVKDIKN
jgi:exodeoxyribonuclease VII large subunit